MIKDQRRNIEDRANNKSLADIHIDAVNNVIIDYSRGISKYKIVLKYLRAHNNRFGIKTAVKDVDDIINQMEDYQGLIQ